MEKLEKKIGDILWECDYSDARAEIASEIQSIAIGFAEYFHFTAETWDLKKEFQDFINNYYNK